MIYMCVHMRHLNVKCCNWLTLKNILAMWNYKIYLFTYLCCIFYLRKKIDFTFEKMAINTNSTMFKMIVNDIVLCFTFYWLFQIFISTKSDIFCGRRIRVLVSL